jgi:hypothetical protein
MGELYRLEFPNGKSYIGISRNGAAQRYLYHAGDARRGRSTLPLYQAWRKHGAPALTVLAVIENDDLPATEIRAIKVFGTLRPAGYNVSQGGQLGAMHDPEVAARVAAALRGRKASPATREKLRLSHLGQKRTAEAIAKTAAANRGRIVSPETRAKISETNKRAAANPSAKRLAARKAHSERLRGRKHSGAHRAAISAANKGRVVTAETRAKIGAAHKGRKLPEERLAKMRGVTKSAETRRRISEGKRGKKQTAEAIAARRQGVANMSPERRAAWSVKLSARIATPETRAKLSAAAKADWAKRAQAGKTALAVGDLFDTAGVG